VGVNLRAASEVGSGHPVRSAATVPLKKVKLQHRRGIQAENGLGSAPMLEFDRRELPLTHCAAKLRASGARRTFVRVRSSTRILTARDGF
jgi:hypothetical protein